MLAFSFGIRNRAVLCVALALLVSAACADVQPFYHHGWPADNEVKLEIRSLEQFDIQWDHQNRIQSIAKTTFPASDNGNNSTSYSTKTWNISYHYDVFGSLTGVRRQLNGSTGYEWKFTVAESGQVVANYVFDTIVPFPESAELELKALAFRGAGGEQLAVDSYFDQPGSGEVVWLFHDQQGSLSHVMSSTNGELNRTETSDTGQVDLLTGGNPEPVLSVIDGYHGYSFEHFAGFSLRGGRLFDSVSQRFLTESPTELQRGNGDLYIREGVAPIGNAPPNHSSTSFFFAQSPFQAGLEAAVQPFFASLQIVGGGLQVAGGAVFGTVTAATVAGAVAGGAVAASGVDDIIAGFRTLYTGEVHRTARYQLALSAFGGNETIANVVDIGAGLVSPAFAASILTKSGQIAKATANLSSIGSRTFNATGQSKGSATVLSLVNRKYQKYFLTLDASCWF